MGRQSASTSVTSKGQVTIPIEIRERLGIRPRDKVRFVIDEDVVRIERELTLDDVFRSVPALKKPLSDRDIDGIIQDERAREYARRHLRK